MSLNLAPERPVAAVGETNNFAVSFAGILDEGEALTGTPTVVEVTTTDLTLTNKAVSTTALTINDKSVSAGEAVQFKVSGQLLATARYLIKITAGTDSTPAQTKVKYVRFRVAGE